MNIDKLLAGPFNLEEFRAAIKEFHPDRAGDDEVYKKLVAWRDSFEPTKVYIRDLDKIFDLGQPIYQGHSSRIFKVTDKALLKKVPSGHETYIKITKDRRLNTFIKHEFYCLSGDLKCFPNAVTNNIYLGETTTNYLSSNYGYMYSTLPCFTIKQIKDKVGTVEDHHIAWMYKRILESLTMIHEKLFPINAPIPEHIAFIPENHGIYYFGVISAYMKKVPSSCPKPFSLAGLQKSHDIKIATNSLLEITRPGPFRNFLMNIGEVSKDKTSIKHSYDLLREFDRFAARLIEKKFYPLVL